MQTQKDKEGDCWFRGSPVPSVFSLWILLSSRAWGGCRDLWRTLRLLCWAVESLAMIRLTLNDSHSPSTMKTSPFNIILSLSLRDIFLTIFHAAFTMRHVSQAVLGVSIGTWHGMLQIEMSGLILVPVSSMRHMGSEL